MDTPAGAACIREIAKAVGNVAHGTNLEIAEDPWESLGMPERKGFINQHCRLCKEDIGHSSYLQILQYYVSLH